MTVYVDDMRAKVGRLVCCHMVADTLEELHAMADAIDLPRRYLDGDHYDPCLAKRARAVALGAVEITRREAVRIRARMRSAGGLTSRRGCDRRKSRQT